MAKTARTAQLDRATVAAIPAPSYDLGKMEVLESGPSTTHNTMLGARAKRHPAPELTSQNKPARKTEIRANVYF